MCPNRVGTVTAPIPAVMGIVAGGNILNVLGIPNRLFSSLSEFIIRQSNFCIRDKTIKAIGSGVCEDSIRGPVC